LNGPHCDGTIDKYGAVVAVPMWSFGDDRRGSTVICIACGEELPREDAREYDKHGDRWEREGKEFEFVCKPCDRRLCHQPRDGLESLLTAADAGEADRDSFLARYVALTEERSAEEQ
jgi:hypothetical protein